MRPNIFGICSLLLLAGYRVRTDDEEGPAPFDSRELARFEIITPDHAIYGATNTVYGKKEGFTDDEMLPKIFIHSIYKFGSCSPFMLSPHCLRRRTNITMTDWKASQCNFIYVLESADTQRFRYQCVVMKMMVARKFMFGRGRLPVYYCQGILRYVYLLTFQKIAIHEFYFPLQPNMPINFEFEFYHGDFLHVHADEKTILIP